jgi:hypothetical protein
VADEVSSIIEEINEELKNDQLFAFFKKHKNAIGTAIAVAVVGIYAHSTWHSRKNEQLQEISNALLDELQFSDDSKSLLIEKLAEDAPSELKPLLLIMKSGKKLHNCRDMIENAEALMALTQKRGVDQVWKDLAIIVCASYRLKPVEELIKMLEPLTEKGRPFRFTAMEFIAMNYNNAGNREKALENLNKIRDDNEAPRSLKKRVSMLLNYIKNNLGEK